MITAQDVHALDINSAYYGVPTKKLMEHAGKAVAHHITSKKLSTKKHILILCGTGNNGGDGFVTARHLAPHYPTTVFLFGSEKDIKTTNAKDNYQKLVKLNIKIYTINEKDQLENLIKNHAILIDAMLGIGLTGNLREPYKTAVQLINSTKNKHIISVDIPTGFGTNSAIKPDYTITFHDAKKGMNKNNSGIIEIADIGIPKQAQTHIGPGDLTIYYPRPSPESHKRDNGVVLIIGGGPYSGAPALAGMAAYRTGTDLVHIATPHHSASTIAGYSPNFIVHGLSEKILTTDDISTIQPLIEQVTSILIGPGLGNANETEHAVQEIINTATNLHKSIVIDADAIQPFSSIIDLIHKSNIIITPHAGEYHKLTGTPILQNIDERINQITTWANKHTKTILLKGPTDIISNGIKTKLNTTHNPAMTVGGTGDVLAGITSALLSKKISPFHAACIGAFINGAAGNEAFAEKSYGLLSTDIIEHIPTILQKYL